MQLTIFEHSKTEKQCAKCKEVKPVTNFCKNKWQKDNLHFYCRQCGAVNYKKNKESMLQYRKDYYQNNKEDYALRKKNYKQNNKVTCAMRSRAYQKKRRTSDPLFRLTGNLRTRVYMFCKSVGLQKNWKTLEALGCNREEFIAYFEPLFTEGMTWQNYGAWHVDHIKPISLATTEQEAIQLSHYTNLQPLWAEDNMRKSNKY